MTGRDGLVRGVILRVGSSEGRVSTLQRPLQRLYPLKVSSMTSEVRSDTSQEGEQAKDVDQGEPSSQKSDCYSGMRQDVGFSHTRTGKRLD